MPIAAKKNSLGQLGTIKTAMQTSLLPLVINGNGITAWQKWLYKQLRIRRKFIY